jgi:ferredoxin
MVLAGLQVDTTAAETDTVFQVALTKSGQSFSCRNNQTVLQAAAQAGLRLPSSCSGGACGTCKTKKVSGQIDMQHAGGIRQREIDQGWMLPCCSKPLSDLALER